jgi:hypothetical protein
VPHETILYENGVHWRFSGVVYLQDFVKANMEVWGLSNWSDFRFQVVDLLGAAQPAISEAEAAGFTKFDAAAATSAPQMRVCLVVDHPYWIALAKIYIEALEIPGWEARIFDDAASAFAWIGVEQRA